MGDDDWKPRRIPGWPRQAPPGEPLFEIYRERDDSRWRCELHEDKELGAVAQLYQNQELIVTIRFERRPGDPMRTPRQLALAWAEEERKAIENDPG